MRFLPVLLAALATAAPRAGAEHPAAAAPDPPPVSPDPSPASSEELRLSCVRNLHGLREPIRRFLERKGILPYWLSDLRTAGLVADGAAFMCPITRRTGALPLVDGYVPDPEVPGSYIYEWNPTPVGPGDLPGEVVTLRAERERQREIAGKRVPLVRCVLHDKVLNLSVGGDVYESGLDWEAEVPDSAVRARLLGAPSAPDPVERLRRAQQWVGVAAPAFALPDLEGRPVTLAAHHGRDVVVLDFWATWCGPCVTLFPEVVALEKEFAGRPVVFYAVNVMESADTARRFLAAKDLPLRVLLDEDGAVARRYEVTGIPRTVIIGKDGAVVGVRVGHAADFAETTRRDLESALGGN